MLIFSCCILYFVFRQYLPENIYENIRLCRPHLRKNKVEKSREEKDVTKFVLIWMWKIMELFMRRLWRKDKQSKEKQRNVPKRYIVSVTPRIDDRIDLIISLTFPSGPIHKFFFLLFCFSSLFPYFYILRIYPFLLIYSIFAYNFVNFCSLKMHVRLFDFFE